MDFCDLLTETIKNRKMSNKIYLYPLPLRIWHATNALLFLMLILTGISLLYSNTEVTLVRFDWAVTIHNICGILLTCNYLLFLLVNIFTSNGKQYQIQIKGFMDRLLLQLQYYIFGIFKGAKAPFTTVKERKFNPLQQFTYVLAMFIGVPFVIITGWALLFPEIIVKEVFGFGGLLITSIFHITMVFAMTIFMVIHVYFCTIGTKWYSNFISIIWKYILHFFI